MRNLGESAAHAGYAYAAIGLLSAGGATLIALLGRRGNPDARRFTRQIVWLVSFQSVAMLISGFVLTQTDYGKPLDQFLIASAPALSVSLVWWIGLKRMQRTASKEKGRT